MPVGDTRSGLDKQKWLTLFVRTMQIVVEPRLHGCGYIAGLVPARITVPRNNVDMLGKSPIIKPYIGSHKIGSNGNIWCQITQWRGLRDKKIERLIAGKSLPIEHQAMHRIIDRLNLLPSCVLVTPESRPPFVIEMVQILIAFLEPLAK